VSPEPRSPLVHRAADLARLADLTGGAVAAGEIAHLAQVSIRADPGVAQRVGLPLPIQPNSVAEHDGRTLVWLGPDEWLALGPPGTEVSMRADLEAVLDGTHSSVVDVSANRAWVELTGPGVRELLAHGTGIDLHPRSWRAGMCAQTLLANVQALLVQTTTGTRVAVRPSFADHLVDWLLVVAGGSPDR
jgi:sarcosine oxidase subunit gamma